MTGVQTCALPISDAYFAEFVPKINAVTASDVTRAAERYLDPAKMHTVIVGDPAQIEGPLRTLDIGEPELLPVEPRR